MRKGEDTDFGPLVARTNANMNGIGIEVLEVGTERKVGNGMRGHGMKGIGNGMRGHGMKGIGIGIGITISGIIVG